MWQEVMVNLLFVAVGAVVGATALLAVIMLAWRRNQSTESVILCEHAQARDIQIQPQKVSFTGDQALVYKANLCLHTALRILKTIYIFQAKNTDDLYKKIQELDWSLFLDCQSTLAIDTDIQSPYFRHSKYAALRVKDAIVDQFRKDQGGESERFRVARIRLVQSDRVGNQGGRGDGDSLHQHTDLHKAVDDRLLGRARILVHNVRVTLLCAERQRRCAVSDQIEP